MEPVIRYYDSENKFIKSIISEVNINNDRFVKYLYYFPNGNLKSCSNIKNGWSYGRQIYYDRKGEIITDYYIVDVPDVPYVHEGEMIVYE